MKNKVPSKNQIIRWERDVNLICVIQCNCGRVHEIRIKYKNWFVSCLCRNNLIYACLINRCRNKVLYRSKYLKNDNIHSFDLFQ
jgi:hypothetical protein